jgi:hypothetical protein
MEQERHPLPGRHSEHSPDRNAVAVVSERCRAALEALVQVDHESEEASVAVRALEITVEMPVELLPNVISVKTQPLVQPDRRPFFSKRGGR